MIDVTATMFPSTVRNERSLFDQIAWRAIVADSRKKFIVVLGAAVARGACSTFTAAPSASVRTELNGPTTTAVAVLQA